MKKKFLFIFALASFLSTMSGRGQSIIGYWEGAILIVNQKLAIRVEFSQSGDSLTGTIDVPEQNAQGLPLRYIVQRNTHVTFELPAGLSVAQFDGIVAADSISGSFAQAGFKGNFILRKATKKIEPEIQEIIPYKHEDIVFFNDTIRLAATLTIPETAGLHPAVVMITGSGPQNRDEELFGFKPFKLIADHLTRKGIAVLRYDDRGVGGSSGSISESTTADVAGDALASVRYLKTRAEIDTTQIGLCGHSEGAIAAPLAAIASKDVAFIILLAGTGLNGEEIILLQSERIMRADSMKESEIRRTLDLNKRSFEIARTNEGWSELRTLFLQEAEREFDKLSPEEKKSVVNKDEYFNTAVNGQIMQLQTKWFQFFLRHEPAPVLEKVACPVLLLFGELDLQVPAQQNRKAMEAALKRGKNRDVTSKVFPKANHLFLSAKTGSPREYASAKKKFVPGFLETISSWILRRTNASSKKIK